MAENVKGCDHHVITLKWKNGFELPFVYEFDSIREVKSHDHDQYPVLVSVYSWSYCKDNPTALRSTLDLWDLTEMTDESRNEMYDLIFRKYKLNQYKETK